MACAPQSSPPSGDARQRSWGTGDDDARKQNDKPCRFGCQDFGQQKGTETLATLLSQSETVIDDKDHELDELDASLNTDLDHYGSPDRCRSGA